MSIQLDPFQHGHFLDDGLTTKSSDDQYGVEKSVTKCFEKCGNLESLKLLRDAHISYLRKGLHAHLGEYYDASRTWLVFWISGGLRLLGENDFLKENDEKITSFIKRCQSIDEGAYGGGPGQCAHLAATYAAVNSLAVLGTPTALGSIDRAEVRRFLCSMQQPDGSFTLHHSGEIDIRGVYCALSVAKLLEIPIFSDQSHELSKDGLFSKTADWVLSCQTYEGGFGAAPGHEAHGGYTFCGVASLVMLGQLHRCDIESLMLWVSRKQLKLEGGFSGRTNKLVDACYTFWNGAIIPIVQSWIVQSENDVFNHWFINQESLQKYVLACCQQQSGGLFDKPGKHCDYYHTLYALSGLSVAQNSIEKVVLGDAANLLLPVHPLYNLPLDSFTETKNYFFDKKI